MDRFTCFRAPKDTKKKHTPGKPSGFSAPGSRKSDSRPLRNAKASGGGASCTRRFSERTVSDRCSGAQAPLRAVRRGSRQRPHVFDPTKRPLFPGAAKPANGEPPASAGYIEERPPARSEIFGIIFEMWAGLTTFAAVKSRTPWYSDSQRSSCRLSCSRRGGSARRVWVSSRRSYPCCGSAPRTTPRAARGGASSAGRCSPSRSGMR